MFRPVSRMPIIDDNIGSSDCTGKHLTAICMLFIEDNFHFKNGSVDPLFETDPFDLRLIAVDIRYRWSSGFLFIDIAEATIDDAISTLYQLSGLRPCLSGGLFPQLSPGRCEASSDDPVRQKGGEIRDRLCLHQEL